MHKVRRLSTVCIARKNEASRTHLFKNRDAIRKTAVFKQDLCAQRSYSDEAVGSVDAKTIRFDAFGSSQKVLQFGEEKIGDKIGDNQVLIKITAAPVHPGDINFIQGSYKTDIKPPAVGGMEGAGRVLKVGSGVKNFAPNDFVSILPSKLGIGTWRTHGVYEEQDIVKVPGGVDPAFAAAIHINPCTAFRLLEDFADLKEGDVVIQNAANSMVGICVLQIAKQRGIKTINLIRKRTARDEIVERMKELTDGPVLTDEDYGKAGFQRMLSQLPKPKLALNAIGGRSATELARHLKDGGTIVTYGAMSHEPVTLPSSLHIFNGIQSKGFWLPRWMQTAAAEDRKKMIHTIFDMVRQRKLNFWMETWKWRDALTAVKHSQKPYRDKKVLITME